MTFDPKTEARKWLLDHVTVVRTDPNGAPRYGVLWGSDPDPNVARLTALLRRAMEAGQGRLMPDSEGIGGMTDIPDLVKRCRMFAGKPDDDDILGHVLSEAATALESLQARLAAAEKVCEAASIWNQYWKARPASLEVADQPTQSLAAALAEWGKGRT